MHNKGTSYHFFEKLTPRVFELFPIILFLFSLFLAFHRFEDPYLYDEDLGEGYLMLRVEGNYSLEDNKLISRVKILGGDFPEIYNRKALLTVYGAQGLPSRHIEAYAKVRLSKGRVYISSSYRNISAVEVSSSLRDRMEKRIEERIEDPEIKSMILSYFLGEEQDILPLKVQSAFLTTGLIHLLVVSGGHLTALALILRYLAPYMYGLALSLLGISIYSILLVPSEPPVLRAYLMAVITILLLLYGERPNLIGILFFSASIILLFYPEYIGSYSFWLSFCATLYILLSLKDPPRKSFTFLSFWVSFFAFLGTMPIVSLFSFSAPFSVILTPILTPLFAFFTTYGFLDMLAFFSLPSFPLELSGKIINSLLLIFSEIAPTLFFKFALWETIFSLSLGAVLLYFLRGWEKLLVAFVFLPFLF